MNGLRSEGDKEWDDLLATMSNDDQKMWQDFRANPPKECWTSATLPEADFIKKSVQTMQHEERRFRKALV
jgi:hypothetical protein